MRLPRRLAPFLGAALVISCLAVGGAAPDASADGGIVPTVAVMGSPNPATTGAVLYSVTVTDPTDAGTPTGTVTVSDGAGGSCPTEDLDASGSGSCSIEEPAGSYSITATYSGDLNYLTAQGTASETVDQASPAITVTPQAGATTGLVSYGVSVAGPAGAVVPTGTVLVTDGTTSGQCTTPALDATGSASCSIAEGAGTYSITATYSSDSNYLSTIGTGSETVGLGLPTVTVTPQAGATTGLVSYGVSVAGPAGAVVPTGTVLVTDGTTSGQCTTPALDATGSASCSIAEGAGTYSITATYSSDSNYLSTIGTGSETVVPAIARVTGSVPTAAVAGDLTYSVTVAGSDTAIVATGTVVVSDLDDPGSPTCTIALVNGTGNCQLLQTPGKYTIKFAYSGDPNYLPPAAPLISETVGFAPELVVVTSSPNPATAKGNGNAKVTYTVTITGSSSLPVPTGSVVVEDETGASCFISNVTAGVGSCSLKEVVGSHTVTATTSGDGDYAFGTAQVTEYVGTQTRTTFSKIGGPVAPGGTITLNAKVTATAKTAGPPNGTVVFVVNGVPQSPVTVVDGVASLTYDVSINSNRGRVIVDVDYQSSDTNTWFDSTTSGGFKVS